MPDTKNQKLNHNLPFKKLFRGQNCDVNLLKAIKWRRHAFDETKKQKKNENCESHLCAGCT